MPLYVLNRNHTLSTLKGHRVVFKKDQPVYVPPPVEADAIAIGATPADGSDPVMPGEVEVKPGADLSPVEREFKIIEAIRKVVHRNEREDFNGANKPKESAISAMTGFKVDVAELGTALQKFYELEFGPQ